MKSSASYAYYFNIIKNLLLNLLALILTPLIGITQEQMADYIDVTIETISNIERGVYDPRFDTMEKIAATLEVTVKDLFDFDSK